MTLYSGGICFLLIAITYYIVDVKGLKKGLVWLKIYGMNAITAYCLGEMLKYNSLLYKSDDPDNDYSVPSFWQNVVLSYDTTKIAPEKVEEKGWSILHDPELEGHVFIYDSPRDIFMIGLKALGYSMNTESRDELMEAYDWLVK